LRRWRGPSGLWVCRGTARRAPTSFFADNMRIAHTPLGGVNAPAASPATLCIIISLGFTNHLRLPGDGGGCRRSCLVAGVNSSVSALMGAMKQAWDTIRWWEVRRIVFNLVVLATGLLSLLVFGFIGSEVLGNVDIGDPFLEVVAYGLLANFFYTFGWIAEILWGWGDTARTSLRRPMVFRLGLIFSAGLTLLPAVIVTLMWILRALRQISN
jgi:hypothetical protein